VSGDSFTKSLDFVQDRIGCSGPHEGLAAAVVVMHEVIDLRHEVTYAAERAAPDGLLGDDVEPDLHLVEPGGIGRGVVHVEARFGCISG